MLVGLYSIQLVLYSRSSEGRIRDMMSTSTFVPPSRKQFDDSTITQDARGTQFVGMTAYTKEEKVLQALRNEHSLRAEGSNVESFIGLDLISMVKYTCDASGRLPTAQFLCSIIYYFHLCLRL